MPGVGYCPQAELAALCGSKASPGGVACRVGRPQGRYAGGCAMSPSPPLGPDPRVQRERRCALTPGPCRDRGWSVEVLLSGPSPSPLVKGRHLIPCL